MHISQPSFIGQLKSDVTKIESLTTKLWDQLLNLDLIAEQLSSGFVERNLQMFSHAIGHFGLIYLNGEFIECTSDGRRIPNPQDAQNCDVQTDIQRARSLEEVRTVVANELRVMFEGLQLTDAVTRVLGILSNIRKNQKLFEGNRTNISHECTDRLGELAKIEADALEEYLESLKP